MDYYLSQITNAPKINNVDLLKDTSSRAYEVLSVRIISEFEATHTKRPQRQPDICRPLSDLWDVKRQIWKVHHILTLHPI